MRNFLQKYGFHLAIWTLMLLFLAFGPKVLGVFRGPTGKPITFQEPLPVPGREITSYLDTLESGLTRGFHTQTLIGWAFLDEKPDQSVYNRFLVLESESRTYIFPVKDVQRPDVQAAFATSKLNLAYSGFSAVLAPDEINPGTYQLGLLFQSRLDSSLHFSLLNSTIQRTPNTLTLLNEIPLTLARLPDSRLVPLEQDLPAPSADIIAYLDGLVTDEASDLTLYQLRGWAFLPGQADQAALERILVLKSTEHTYALLALAVQRPDVQTAYQSLGLDLSLSGFEVFFSEGAIPPGEYSIGILFRRPGGEMISYFLFKQVLLQQNGTWLLK